MSTVSQLFRSRGFVAPSSGQRLVRHSVVFAAGAALVLVLMLTSAALVYADADHTGWPTEKCAWQNVGRGAFEDPETPGCGVYKSHPFDENGTLQGTGDTDELLGGDGNDTIYGGGAGDVIWGDKNPCCQPTDQHDSLHGGTGKDFIYASHGTNNIDAGPGNDVVHAHFGRRGNIDCGSGTDTLFLSKKSQRHYSVRGCEKITFKVERK